MPTRIGVRELREKLAEYLESTMPIAVTRHGQTIGFYIPVPKQPALTEREAMLNASRRLHEEMARLGVGEDDLLEDFKHWRKHHHAA